MLIPLLLAPIWFICVVVSLFLLPSPRAQMLRRYLACCSTVAVLGSALGGLVAGLFVDAFCSGDKYSCMHAGIFFGLLGNLGGLPLGLYLGSSIASKVRN